MDLDLETSLQADESFSSTSSVVLKAGGNGNGEPSSSSDRHQNQDRTSVKLLPAPAVNIPGFASIVNLKGGESCSVTTRGGRRIQISRIGGAQPKEALSGSGSTGTGGSGIVGSISQVFLTAHEFGEAAKRRWSFHTSNPISELFKQDKALKPISPNKRRKSGVGIAEPTEITPSTSSEPDGQGHKKAAAHELSRSSRQHHNVLTNHQQRQNQHHHRRLSTGRIISLREPQVPPSSKRRHQLRSEYLPRIDPYDLAFHPFRFGKKSKHLREAPPQPDYLSTLPDEVLLRIFKQLPKPSLANLGRTSQRFLKVVHDETLWKRLCVMGKTLLPEHLLLIMTRKPIYLRMARAWIPDPDEIPNDLETLAASSQLLYLDLTAASISPSTLALLMKISPKLEKLSLEHLTISKEVIVAMMGFAPTIEVLNLTICLDLDPKLFVRFLSSCKRLKELNIGCMRCDWSHEDLTSVVCALPETLQFLNISGYRSVLDNSHVSIITSRCPNLIELDISDSAEVKSKTIEYVLKLPRLQHLGVSRCYGIEAQVYTLLAGHKCLKYLDLYSLFKEASLRQLSSSLPKIEINKFPFSAVARPTVGNKRSSIWLERVRD